MGFKSRKRPEPVCKHDDCWTEPQVFGYCYTHAKPSSMITMIVDLKSQLHKANTKIGRLESGTDDCARITLHRLPAKQPLTNGDEE